MAGDGRWQEACCFPVSCAGARAWAGCSCASDEGAAVHVRYTVARPLHRGTTVPTLHVRYTIALRYNVVQPPHRCTSAIPLYDRYAVVRPLHLCTSVTSLHVC